MIYATGLLLRSIGLFTFYDSRQVQSVLEALRELDGESNPRVMLISLKGVQVNSLLLGRAHEDHVAGALGLNLTVANNVFL